MYNKIMVPLDGSKLAESVLDHVKTIAKGCNVPEVILFSVNEQLPAQTLSALAEAGGNLLDKAIQDKRDQTKSYLAKIDADMKKGGIKSRVVIVDGKADMEIAEYANKNQVDLIVISTHGRSGVSRWVWGSTTDRVLRSSCVPILMARAPGCVPGL